MLQILQDIFSNPAINMISGMLTYITLVGVIITIIVIIKGNFRVWYRLGRGLSNRKIAVFANSEFPDLKIMLLRSKLFRKKNIEQFGKGSVRTAADYSLLMVHYKPFASQIDEILRIKKDTSALILYCPKGDGDIKSEDVNRICSHPNVFLANFKGKLLNDLFVAMITTA